MNTCECKQTFESSFVFCPYCHRCNARSRAARLTLKLPVVTAGLSLLFVLNGWAKPPTPLYTLCVILLVFTQALLVGLRPFEQRWYLLVFLIAALAARHTQYPSLPWSWLEAVCLLAGIAVAIAPIGLKRKIAALALVVLVWIRAEFILRHFRSADLANAIPAAFKAIEDRDFIAALAPIAALTSARAVWVFLVAVLSIGFYERLPNISRARIRRLLPRVPRLPELPVLSRETFDLPGSAKLVCLGVLGPFLLMMLVTESAETVASAIEAAIHWSHPTASVLIPGFVLMFFVFVALTLV